MAPELIKILNSIILHYHVPQLNSLIAYRLYENHKWGRKAREQVGGHTGVWVQALSRVVTRLELDDFIRDLTLYRGLMLPKVSGGARYVSK